MTARKPLVNVSGVLTELASTDALDVTSNLPQVVPAILLDFANGKILGSRLTYSRASAATHTNELSTLISDAANVSRFNHLDGVSKGLLIEEAATNLFINSEDFTGVATRTTVNANAVTALADSLADEMIETTDNTEHFVNDRTISVTSGDNIFYAINIKQTATTANRRFLLRLYGAVTASVYIDFSTNSVATSSGASSSGVTVRKNGWLLAWLKATASSTATVGTRIQFAKSDNTSVYAGDTTEKIAIWGGRFFKDATKAPAALSYIKTAGSSVTRALDLLTVSTTNFNFYRHDEYSCYVKFYGQAIGTCTIFDFHDATANERIYLESINGTLTLKIVDGGVEKCSLALDSVVTGTEYRVAAAWKLNDIAASINGATVVTDTSATLPTPTQMSIGSNYAGANQINAEISKISGYAIRLTNTELQGLSL